jgi:hypothetical protein
MHSVANGRKDISGWRIWDLFAEVGVMADGSVAGVIDGRKYSLAFRLQKLLYEECM